MQFLYAENAGSDEITLINEQFLHLKARRVKPSDLIEIRNLKDGTLYRYKILDIARKSIDLKLIDSVKDNSKTAYNSHIVWCIVDSKIIEKTVPFLNELGVGKVTLVWCEKSQKNIHIDEARLKRIIYASCEQCGRVDPMSVEIKNPSDLSGLDLVMLDFEGDEISSDLIKNSAVLIGPEAGFSAKDYECFSSAKRVSTKNSLIMRSETATIFIASLWALQ